MSARTDSVRGVPGDWYPYRDQVHLSSYSLTAENADHEPADDEVYRDDKD